ncbi:hypothetical protein J6590_020007 [Homalodisca vitripennis]|nr:hypothetical protein J6590_020007 [Homalodisca vitripennis]
MALPNEANFPDNLLGLDCLNKMLENVCAVQEQHSPILHKLLNSSKTSMGAICSIDNCPEACRICLSLRWRPWK